MALVCCNRFLYDCRPHRCMFQVGDVGHRPIRVKFAKHPPCSLSSYVFRLGRITTIFGGITYKHFHFHYAAHSSPTPSYFSYSGAFSNHLFLFLAVGISSRSLWRCPTAFIGYFFFVCDDCLVCICIWILEI